jgi:hypothetical protein
MVSKMLVSVMAWILGAVLAAQLLLLGVPLFRRLVFDAACHQCLLRMDLAGGLTAEDRVRLIAQLEDHGFVVDQLSGTAHAAFGQDLTLSVTAHAPSYRILGNLTRQEVALSYTYQGCVLCRKLFNYAAAPSGRWLSWWPRPAWSCCRWG